MVTYTEPIQPGNTIGLVLPSSMITQETLDSVLRAAQKLGLKCQIGKHMQHVVRLFTAQQDGYIDPILTTFLPIHQLMLFGAYVVDTVPPKSCLI